jgi:hypothetical protein
VNAADPPTTDLRGPGRLAWPDVSAGDTGTLRCEALVGGGVPLAVQPGAVDALAAVTDRARGLGTR